MTTDPTPPDPADTTDQDSTAEATTPWFRVCGTATPEEVAAIAVALGELERERTSATSSPRRPGWATAARREGLGGRPLAGTAALHVSDRFT